MEGHQCQKLVRKRSSRGEDMVPAVPKTRHTLPPKRKQHLWSHLAFDRVAGRSHRRRVRGIDRLCFCNEKDEKDARKQQKARIKWNWRWSRYCFDSGQRWGQYRLKLLKWGRLIHKTSFISGSKITIYFYQCYEKALKSLCQCTLQVSIFQSRYR